MKKFILGAILLFSTLTFSQETEFKFQKEGFTDFVVINIPNKKQSELYQKCLDWIQFTYNSPKEVLKATIENEYIRFEGIYNRTDYTQAGCKYIIEIYFKDDKYKFDVISYIHPSSGTDLLKTSNWVNKSGEFRKHSEDLRKEHENVFNNLNNSFKNFIESKSIKSDSNNW